MSDNIFVEEQKPKQEPINFATVTGIFADGLTLKFDGEEQPTQKHYKCNSFCVFKVGDRVRIIKDSGTYVVEYTIGNPITSFIADDSLKADYSLYLKNNDDDEKLIFSVNNSGVYVFHPTFKWIQIK